MEAAGGEMASAMAVTSTSGTVKKIFRARKTMTASCRQQIATLNKIKNSSKIGTVVKESLVLSNNDVQQQQTNIILVKKCISQLSTASEMEIHWSQSPSPNGFKTSVESPVLPKEHVQQQTEFVLVKNCITLNNTSSEMESHQSHSPYPDGFKTSAESPVLPKDDIQQQQTELILVNCITRNNTLSEMEIHQSQSPISGFKTSAQVSHDSGLKTESSLEEMWEDESKTCENSDSGVVSSTIKKTQFGDVSLVSSTGVVEKGKPISDYFDYASLQDIGKDSLKTNIDNSYPVTEAINESSSLPTINEDFFLEMNSAIGLVTPLDDLDTDSTKASVPSNESNGSCGTTGTSNSLLPNVPVNLHVDSAYNVSQDCNLTGDCDKKRSFSGDAGVPEAKRAKTSNKILLVEIDHLIQRRIQTVFKESFDQRIQDLSQQINLIQCKEDNDLLTRHLGSIRRLGRRIKYAIRVQNEVGTQSSKLPSVSSTCKELSKPEAAVISCTNTTAEETSASLTETNDMSADCSTLVVLSDNETEEQSDQGQTEHPKNPSRKVNHSAIRKIMESIKEHRNRTLSSRMDKQPMAVIDLTDDEEQKADSDLKLDAAHLSPSHAMPSSPAPVREDIKDENLPKKCSEQKEKLSENKKEYSHDVTEKTFSGHKSVNTHDSVAYLEKSPNPDPQILKPPQKPELRLAQVQNPKGIALSWNITQTDPSCAPAQVYCLYVHQENPKNSKKLWKKIGEIKALPLPMACTLTQFVDDATYSFVLRAKDASGRFGPLCDIQSTTLKSLNTPKKT